MTELVICTLIICVTVVFVAFIVSAFKAYADIEKVKANPMTKLFGGSNGDER